MATTKKKSPALADVGLDRLVPYEGNPRHNDQAVERMVQTIEAHGFRVPVLVRGRDDGRLDVIDGHLRLKAARVMGRETVPTLDVSDMTDAQVATFRVAVNRAQDWAEWDDRLLAEHLVMIREIEGIDLFLTGFSDTEVTNLLASLEPPVPPAEFPTHDETVKVDYTCPKCGYKWSGG